MTSSRPGELREMMSLCFRGSLLRLEQLASYTQGIYQHRLGSQQSIKCTFLRTVRRGVPSLTGRSIPASERMLASRNALRLGTFSSCSSSLTSEPKEAEKVLNLWLQRFEGASGWIHLPIPHSEGVLRVRKLPSTTR